jgi:phosphatidylglycerol:prolipoprotein diacylglycerol transferase
MHPVLLDLSFIKIPTYGFFILVSYLISLWYLLKIHKDFEIDRKVVEDLSFYLVFYGFIGAKILYIITFFNQFGNTFSERLLNSFSFENIRSGFVFYGGVIAGVIYFYIYTKKKKINFLNAADLFARVLPLSHAIGRLGCFSAGCCHGKPTSSIFGVRFTDPMCSVESEYIGVPIHPTQLYESFGNILIFIILIKISSRKRVSGFIFFSYLILYSILRFIVEFFRGDERGSFYFGFSQAQIISIILMIFSIYFIWKKKLWREK